MSQESIEGFRLSPQQARLWQLHHGHGTLPLPYQAWCTVRLSGPLQPALLRAALDQLVRRHEILRTTFQALPSMTLPLQVVAEHLSPRWTEVRGDNGPALDAAAQVAGLWQEWRQQPFDWEHGPLLQATLVRCAPQQHLLLLRLPALCTDVVGLAHMVRELSRCYGASQRGDELVDAPLQYADLAEWQHDLLVSQDTAAGRAYWQQQRLADGLMYALPCAPPRRQAGAGQPEAPELVVQAQAVVLEEPLVVQIETLARQQDTSVALVLLAGWQLLLGRLTGQADVVVGTLCDGRNYEELHNALGLCARYVPVCSHLDEPCSVREFLHQLAAAARHAETWQECFTWEDIADVAGAGEAPPFFPYCFDYAPAPMTLAAGEVTFIFAQAEACIDRFEVRLACAREPEGLRAILYYNAQCYRPEDMARLAQQWLTVVRSIVRAPEAPLWAVEVLSTAERTSLLAAGVGPQRTLETEMLLHHLIEVQAARRPDAIALVGEDDHLSYGALNRRANQLAHYLQKLGVEPEVCVGLSMARSPELLVGLLGIVKAGGACMPLEPDLPAERLASMVTAAQPRVLLTHEQWRERLPALGTQVVCLDSARAQITQESTAHAPSGVRAENVVYVLFTSGSTGEPKGVAVEHRHLCHYLASITERLGLEAGARYATVTTLAADLGHTVVFPALTTGGCLHVVRHERAADPAALAEYLHRQAIDCVKMVPAHLAALLTVSPGAAELPRQRLVLGGDVCGWEVVQRVQALAPACVVFNHYGPTETTVGVLTHRVEPEAGPETSATVPLGRPLGNTQVYVLDAHLQPVPTWVPGEVYIGGAQVGRGYVQQPALTAERFVPDPFGSVPGGRLYRTGDVARWLPDGTLEFVGRSDHQVKLRGFRVELGEIETVLRQHPTVQASVVVVRQAGSEAQRLVAYVAGRAGTVPEAEELRRFMQQRLPDYMIPATVVPLTALPLTPNGKVNRAALPALEEEHRGVAAESPRTPLEELVAGLWAEVLGLPQVGRHDDFFALGGHSLLVTRVAARLSEALQVEFPFRLLFEKRTVAELVESIARARHGEQHFQTPPLLPVARHTDLPLSFAQQRLWFFDQLEPCSTAYNIPGAVRLSGELNIAALEHTFTAIVCRHEVLRTTFTIVEGQPRQVIAPTLRVGVPLIDLRECARSKREAEAQRLAQQEARRPFALDRGPLLRIGLLQLDEREYILLLTMHHIVSDAWSMEVLVREVAALYAAFATGKPSPLPDLPVQYADFACWQRQWLQGEVLESYVAYWKQQLDGAPAILELPTDRPRPARQTWRGARASLVLSAPLTTALKALSRREGVTLFMTLLAAFQTLIRHYTAQDDIVVGTNTANRSHPRSADLIGFFVNQLVLRTDLSGNPRFRELLSRVRAMALGVYAHQDLPFDKLVEELRPPRDTSRSLLFQMKFELQDGTARILELPGLTLTPLEIDYTVVRHDLHLFMMDRGQELVGALLYNLDLFEASTIARILRDFETLLSLVVAQPDVRLHELDAALTTRHRQQQSLTEQALAETSWKMLQGHTRKGVRA